MVKDLILERTVLNGAIKKLMVVTPSEVDFINPQYAFIDGIYSAGLIVVNYARNQEGNWMTELFNLDFDTDISMFYEKLESAKVVRELTYYIGNIHGEIKTVNSNQQDIDLISTSLEDAKYIRREIQVNNEELYHLSIYISVFSKDLHTLKYNIERLEGICASLGLLTRRATFRQEQIIKVMLPTGENIKDIKQSAARNVLTSSLASTFPFVSSQLCDENGIVIGNNFYNNSLVMVNRFLDREYKNSNMTVLGTSGAGKSFFAKLMIIRNRYLGTNQFVLDPENEYGGICDSLDGTLIKIGPSSNTHINILDIRENMFSEKDEKNGYLAEKLSRLKGFFKLIFKNMTENEECLIENKLIECYMKSGITFDDESLFEEEKEFRVKRRFKAYDKMPILQDLYDIAIKEKRLEKFSAKLNSFVNGANSFFNGNTNVNLDNKLIVADIHDMNEEVLPIGMYLITDLFWDKIKQERATKKIIYLDEIWRLIGSSGNIETAEFVFKLFKTARKYGCGATAITQDISDFFSMENGKYGKAVINNSAFKMILQLEEEDVKLLKDILCLSEEEEMRIKTLSRGTGILFAGKNHVAVNIVATGTEKDIIENA